MTSIKKWVATISVAAVAIIIGVTGYQWVTGNSKSAIPEITTKSDTTETRPAVKESTTAANDLPIEGLQLFTKKQLEEVTGINLTVDNLTNFRQGLAKPAVWQMLGYSQGEAEQVGERFASSQNQAEGILREMATDEGEQLKVIIVANHVNIGATDDLSKEHHVAPHDALTPYKEIDIEFELGLQEITLSWELEKNQQVEASFENEGTGERLTGEKAQDRIAQALAGVDFESGNKETIFTQISQQLEVPVESVTSFEYDITKSNGQKTEGELRF